MALTMIMINNFKSKIWCQPVKRGGIGNGNNLLGPMTKVSNQGGTHIISEGCVRYEISDIKTEGYLNTLIHLISDWEISTFANIWYQTGTLSEYFNII